MKYFLAIDGGGTKTSVLCADEQGQIVGEGHSGPTSLTVTSVGAASFALREGLRQAVQNLGEDFEVERAVMGLAGMDVEAERTKAQEVFSQVIEDFKIKKFILVNDIQIALRSGTDQPNAVAIISGTGSNCYGVNGEDAQAKTGGMDFLLTDQGSGYDIGRSVLRAAVKSYDGRSEKSLLEELVKKYFKIADISELKQEVYDPLLSKMEVAALATLAFEALEQRDITATEIINGSVDSLYKMASVVIRRLGMEMVSFDCVLAGKIMSSEYIQERLSSKLKLDFPNINIIIPDKGPVYGALKLAME